MAEEKTIPVHNVPGLGTVHFPATMSEQDISDAIRRLPEQKAIRNKISDLSYGRRDRTEAPSTMETLGRGAMDVVDRLSQVNFYLGEKLGIYPEGLGEAGTQAFNQEQQEYDRFRRQGLANELKDPEQLDVGRLAGSVGMTAPLALIPGGQSYLGSAGYGALGGGAAGMLQYDPTYSMEGTAKNVGVGAGIGAIAGPVMRGVTQGAQHMLRSGMGKFKGLMEKSRGAAKADEILREVPEMGALPPEVRADLIMEAQRQIKETGTLNTEQLARKANLIANDVTPTKSMVTRSPRDWSMERNMKGLMQSPDDQISAMGQQLTDVYRGNDAALAARLESFSKGLPKATQEGHGQAIMESLDRLSAASQKEVSALYNRVRDTVGDQLASDAKSLYSTLDNLKDSTYSEKMVGSVMNKLKRFGMIDKDGNLTAKTLTVTQAEELRKFVNTLPNDYGKRDIIKAIDADVLQGAGEDAFGMARKAAQGRFEMLENAATKRALNAYGELTQGKTAQNFIKSQIIDGPAQDVDSLLRTLSKLPSEEAQDATLRIRAGVLDFLQGKAVNETSNKFSGAALNKAIGQIGEEKLEMVLGSQGLKELKSLARAGVDATYEPAYSAVNHSNTAPTLLAMTQKARAVPGIPLILNQNLENAAARSAYQSQLGKVLSAGSEQPLPQVPERIQSLIRLIQQSGAPAASGTVNQQRDK